MSLRPLVLSLAHKLFGIRLRPRSAPTGEALELTERTVRRDWEKARLLLGAMLKD